MTGTCAPADVVSETRSIGLQNPGGAIRIACEAELTRSSSARGVVPLTCREFADFMMDYLSDELSTESRATFEYHLNVCPNCQRYLASYRETIKLGKRAFGDPDADLPSQVPEELVKAILAARPKQ
jgi:anti-sigma factor RsiW